MDLERGLSTLSSNSPSCVFFIFFGGGFSVNLDSPLSGPPVEKFGDPENFQYISFGWALSVYCGNMLKRLWVSSNAGKFSVVYLGMEGENMSGVIYGLSRRSCGEGLAKSPLYAAFADKGDKTQA